MTIIQLTVQCYAQVVSGTMIATEQVLMLCGVEVVISAGMAFQRQFAKN